MPESEALVVTGTKDWNWEKEYNVQLPESGNRDCFSDISHGDFLLLETDQADVHCSVFGKVDLRETDHVDQGQVGIGLDLRQALGVCKDETVRVVDATPPGTWRRRLGEALVRRPILCRIRKSVHPDIGFNVCRISRAAMDDLGVNPGDNVIIESTKETCSLKALPLREEISESKREQIKQHPSRYPDPVEELELDRITGTDIDIPSIYIDAERREKLDLDMQTTVKAETRYSDASDDSEDDGESVLTSGVCQPVKVSRNSVSSYLRSLNDNTVTVVIGLLGTVALFRQYLSFSQMIAAVGVGVLLVVLSITYRVRKTAID